MGSVRTALTPYSVRNSNLSQTDAKYMLTLQQAQPLTLVDTSAGSYSETLPPAGPNPSTGQSNMGQELIFRKISADGNTFMLTGSADGPLTLTAPASVVRVKSNGIEWRQV